MGATPVIPIPGMGNDPTGGQVNPADLLRRIYMQQQPATQTQGSVTSGPAMPQPQTPHHAMPLGPQQAAGEYATKGAHQRASMQSLGQTLQNTVAQANNALQQHEQKVLSQKTDAYSHAVQGIEQADEMLKADPTNAEAAQMKARNQDFLKAFLDPTTPEGKKNIKMLTKAYGVQDGEKTPEQVAAEGSTKKVQAQAKLVAQAQKMQDGSAFPQTAQISPITQLHAEMVRQGVQPKAATGGQVLAAQTGAAKQLDQSQDKQQQLQVKQDMQKERLGLDDQGQPKPLDQLPPAQRARIESERAGDALKSVQSQLVQAKQAVMTDPKSIPNQLALMRIGALQKFASASMLRAQVGLMRYNMDATGTGPDGKPIPGATEINGQTVGPKFASAATKAIQTQAQFIDADGAIDNLDAAAKALQQSGSRFNDPRLTKLLSDPHFKAGDSVWIDKQLNSTVGASLTSQQRDYIIAQKQAVENIQAIRRILGTGVSVKAMDAITSTLPGAQTPDYDYAARQIQAVKGQLGRLQQGVPKVNIPSRANQPGAGSDRVPQPTPDKLTNDLNEALKF
jgi:hypothetical protein